MLLILLFTLNAIITKSTNYNNLRLGTNKLFILDRFIFNNAINLNFNMTYSNYNYYGSKNDFVINPTTNKQPKFNPKIHLISFNPSNIMAQSQQVNSRIVCDYENNIKMLNKENDMNNLLSIEEYFTLHYMNDLALNYIDSRDKQSTELIETTNYQYNHHSILTSDELSIQYVAIMICFNNINNKLTTNSIDIKLSQLENKSSLSYDDNIAYNLELIKLSSFSVLFLYLLMTNVIKKPIRKVYFYLLFTILILFLVASSLNILVYHNKMSDIYHNNNLYDILAYFLISIGVCLLYYVFRLVSRSYCLINIFENESSSTEISNLSDVSIDKLNSEYYTYEYEFKNQSFEIGIFMLKLVFFLILVFFLRYFTCYFNLSQNTYLSVFIDNSNNLHNISNKYTLTNASYVIVYSFTLIFIGIGVMIVYLIIEDYKVSINKSRYDLKYIKGTKHTYIAIITNKIISNCKVGFFANAVLSLIYFILVEFSMFIDYDTIFYLYYKFIIIEVMCFILISTTIIWQMYCFKDKRVELYQSIYNRSSVQSHINQLEDFSSTENDVESNEEEETKDNSGTNIILQFQKEENKCNYENKEERKCSLD